MVLDHFRAPYQVACSPALRGVEQLRSRPHGARLLWPTASVDPRAPIAAFLGDPDRRLIPIFAGVIPDRVARTMLFECGGHWSPTEPLWTVTGEPVGSVWQRDDGSLFLPFDPDQALLNYLSEAYHKTVQAAASLQWQRLAIRAYYRSRRLLPRSAQIWARRRYARIQARARFPAWPIETALHDFLEFSFCLVESIAGQPVPRIAAWPSGHEWAFVLTHDVETKIGLAAIDPIVELERALGLRSSWNFVPRRYSVGAVQIRDLLSGGFEVGVHGLYHDGRDLESEATLRDRLPAMQRAAAQWDAVGFRSPATQRNWEMMPLLGFDYDSSYPDTDPFEPQNGGCCSWLPFFNRDLVELPMTMPQDHTLFVILQHLDETAWVEKAEALRSRGGMVLLTTHPDYLTSDRAFHAYRRFLERFAFDETAWRCLPRDVSQWWRRRADSHLELGPAGWSVTGPAAAEARVVFGAPQRVDSRPALASQPAA